jgi:hypothetical protein
MRRGGWTDEEIDRELRRFLDGRRAWPSYAEFVAGGRRSLREAITRHHGARAWAARVGVDWVERRPGHAPRWTPERVNTELEAFLAGREAWPSRREFDAAGLNLLREAVNRLGGVEAWAAKFGLPRPNNSAGSTRIWDERRLQRAVGPLVKGLGRWPTKREFRDAGLESAQAAMYRYGGVERWRKHFSIASAPPHGPVPNRRVWTDQRIERELRAYCAGRSDWPAFREFTRDGKARLYKAASLHGGIGRWQRQLGLKPPRRGASSTTPAYVHGGTRLRHKPLDLR